LQLLQQHATLFLDGAIFVVTWEEAVINASVEMKQ
jgi:hypothetical protein